MARTLTWRPSRAMWRAAGPNEAVGVRSVGGSDVVATRWLSRSPIEPRSNDSAVRVFTGTTLNRVINVEHLLRASFGRLPEIFANGHRHFEAVGWLNSEELQFRVRAYDREPGNEYIGLFRYNLAGKVTRELVP